MSTVELAHRRGPALASLCDMLRSQASVGVHVLSHRRRRVRWTAAAMSALACALACSGTKATAPPTGDNGVVVAPDSVSIAVGGSTTLTATPTSGPTTGVTFFWSSSDTIVAVVSQTGVVTARATGTANIAASAQGKSGVATVVVVPQGVGSILVVPATATLRVNSTLQMSDTIKDSTGAVLTGRTVTWASDNTAAATVDASGLVVAHAVGTVHITASSGRESGSAAVTVTLVPVARITITPRAPTVVVQHSTQLTATPFDSAGNPLAGNAVTWQSGAPSIATVSTTGLVTGVSPGTVVIGATSEQQSAADTVTVVAAGVSSIVLTPPSSAIFVAQAEQLTAQVTDMNGLPVTNPSVAYSSSNTAVASVSATGLVTGVAPGMATITGTSGGKSGQAAVQVMLVPVASVVVSPATDTLIVGAKATLQAAVLDSASHPLAGRPVTWTSSNPGVAAVDDHGTVSAVLPGTTVITAASGGKTGVATVTVTVVPVASVVVSPAVDTLRAGRQQQLAAAVQDAQGNVLVGRTVAWTSSNSAVAVVDGSGLVTAVAAGSATVTATCEGVQGSAAITVTRRPLI